MQGPPGLLSARAFFGEMFGPYWLGWLVAAGTLALACLKRPNLPAAPPVRGPASLTHFTAILVWGAETALRATESLQWGHYYPLSPMPWKLHALLAATATLGLLLGAAFLSEAVARWRRLPARVSSATLPLPIAAAVAAGYGSWWLAMLPFLWVS